MPLHSINPATGEVLRSFAPLEEDALRTRIAHAHEAAAELRSMPLEHRVLCLRKLASLLEEERGDLARTITLETGKPVARAREEIARCSDSCRYHAENAVRLLAPELLPSDGAQAYLQWSPLGVVLAVMPWESPFWQAFRFVIPALLGGNAILLKHAVHVPQCSLQIEVLARRAGFPRGALTVLLLEDRMVETVLADERVAAVTVNSNEATGRAIAAQAGWLLKKSALQLSASDPMIVMPSADLDAAVDAAVRAISGGSGVCRIILASGIYNDVLQRLTTCVEALRVGDPMREETAVGPLGTADDVALLEEQVKAAVAAGGRIVSGGARLVGRGNFFEPTLLTDVPHQAPVARDPLPGPIAMIFRARDLQDAIAMANGTPFGRAASVWTEEPAEQQQLIAGVDAGFVALNALPADNPRLPVGGTRRSGYGRELGAQGVREFLSAKTVAIGQ